MAEANKPPGHCTSDTPVDETYLEVARAWNDATGGSPMASVRFASLQTRERKRLIGRALQRLGSVETAALLFAKVAEDPFLCGDNPSGWIASIDHVLSGKHLNGLMERFDIWAKDD